MKILSSGTKDWPLNLLVEGHMGHNDHGNTELSDKIEDLVDEAYIEKPSKEYGVAQQVIMQGEGSLTPKQRVVWEKGVIPVLQKRGEEIEANHILGSNPD
jgi:hypothetical protein